MIGTPMGNEADRRVDLVEQAAQRLRLLEAALSSRNALLVQAEGENARLRAENERLRGEVVRNLPELTDENLARVPQAALDAWFERRGWVREEKPGLWGSTHSWYPPGVVGSCINEVPVPPVHSPMYVYELRNTLRHIYLYDVEIFEFSRRMMLTELLADSQPPLRKDDDAVPA